MTEEIAAVRNIDICATVALPEIKLSYARYVNSNSDNRDRLVKFSNTFEDPRSDVVTLWNDGLDEFSHVQDWKPWLPQENKINLETINVGSGIWAQFYIEIEKSPNDLNTVQTVYGDSRVVIMDDRGNTLRVDPSGTFCGVITPDRYVHVALRTRIQRIAEQERRAALQFIFKSENGNSIQYNRNRVLEIWSDAAYAQNYRGKT